MACVLSIKAGTIFQMEGKCLDKEEEDARGMKGTDTSINLPCVSVCYYCTFLCKFG